ncbi:MAG: chitobiase/beta-hexosaminidase C-terminal domain-containing protein, partial [Limisphaerales bacterium]
QQGRGLGATAWLMAQNQTLRTQPWKAVNATITGLPSSTPAKQNITIGLSAPGLDLSQATIVWEARDQEPTPGSTFTFAPKNTGAQWVEAEALLPDGRRVFAKADFNATTATDTTANSTVSSPWPVSPDMAALYRLDNNLNDSTGKQLALTRSGNTTFDSSNLGWMQNRSGATLLFRDLGDQASVSIPFSHTWANDTQAIIVEAMICVNAFKGANRGNATILALERNWNAFLELREDMYAGPVIRLGNTRTLSSSLVSSALPRNVWNHIRMVIDKTGYTVRINGNTIATVASTDLNNWSVNVPATLRFGNFDGWIDEVVVRHVRTSYPDSGTVTSPAPTVAAPVITPNGGTHADSVSVSMSATNGATIRYTTDGTNPTADSRVYSSPLTVTSSGTIKAAAFLNGAVSSVTTATFTVNITPPPVAAPVFSPNGGTFTDSVSVSLSSATVGATIRFTTDGSTPTAESRAYSSPLTVTASGTIRAAAFLNGVASSVASATFTINPSTLPPSTNTVSATFVRSDTTTLGNWKGPYGSEGYAVIGDATSNPAYAQVTTSGKADWVWRSSTTDLQGLLKANSTTDRILAVWYSATQFTVDVNITDGKPHRMSAYFLDWDNQGRAQTVQILDGNTGAILDTQTVSNFTGGRYLSWDVSGKVRLRVTRTAGVNAVMSGLFFDGTGVSSTPPPVVVNAPVISPNTGTFTNSVSVTMNSSTTGATIRYTTDGSDPTSTSTAYNGAFNLTTSRTVKAAAFLDGVRSGVTTANITVVASQPIGTRAKFIRADTTTRGTWKGVYGSEGYTIVGNAMKIPTYTQAYPFGKTDWIWQFSTTNINGLQKETGSDRILAVWTAPSSFTVEINIRDNQRHRLSLYFCDWDNRGRTQDVEIIDVQTGKVLNKQSLSSFSNGRYLTWEVSGNIRVRVTRTGPSNAV